MWIAEAINIITSGNKYVPGILNPTADQIDYLWGQATGGVGREASKLNQTSRSTDRWIQGREPGVSADYGCESEESDKKNNCEEFEQGSYLPANSALAIRVESKERSAVR
ncbi:hypothetical protein SAMN05216412_11346 [Nitrosospira multiformis]|uniref:Uncharacterized protein n=1 Tax=Nitrosospira multiformis TaxID=1231 RepID=A0A1I0GIP9_9PROT|nr:LPD38 domain-containing protein [Nitrosospira multiformis]SET70209.1 hypothetical protein SAMN05216412_11346 [Nitrosospira multiformis]